MRRLISTSVLALVALAAVVANASAATKHAPVITSFSPAPQVRVGDKLIIKGKYFKKGIKNNRVFFSRASDGKTVRARPSKANSTRRLEVVVPAGVANFLTISNGQPTGTRFQLQVLSGKFSKKTPKSKSPIILPANAVLNPGTQTPGGTTVTPPPAPDCDGDGTPDAQDSDDDNDGLPDTLEMQIHTDTCKADTDGDGVNDAFEYYSALDLNGNALPYPGKRPYPNPLDGTDASKDFDGDGMTMQEEFAAWVYSGSPLPAGPGQSFAYSDGNQTSPAPNGVGAMDLNENGIITDDEKDADNDGLPNWVEMAKGESAPGSGCAFSPTTAPNPVIYVNAFTDCGSGPMPNGNTFGASVTGTTTTGGATPPYIVGGRLNYIDPDTDGDGVTDAADDNDFDGFSNLEEITAGGDGYYTEPDDPCDPNPNSRACPVHPSHQ